MSAFRLGVFLLYFTNTICVSTKSAWAEHKAEHCQQLIDVLHVSHMWEATAGIDFSSEELLAFDLHPAHRLHIAQRYGLQGVDWIDTPIRILLSAPLVRYYQASTDSLDFGLYMIIATAKESIATARKRLGTHPPFPSNFDNGPFCDQHATCKKVWFEKWFFVVLRRIHHPSEPFPLTSIPETLTNMEHRGMNAECKQFVLNWLRDECIHVQKEEQLIQETITTVRNLFK
jgi:hypothetical protein